MEAWDWTLACWVVLAAALAYAMRDDLRRAWRELRDRRQLPQLDALDVLTDTPESGVWRLTPPCGYETWDLYAPGTERTPDGFLMAEPTARFDAINGPGRQRADDPVTRLVDIEPWARPWIEQVAGRPVVEMHEGWSAPYGPGGKLREYVVFAIVEHPRGVQIEVLRPGARERTGEVPRA